MTGDGTGVIAHAGSVAVRMLADRTGLTGALSAALARQGFTPGHDRGRVLVDVATMITAGGRRRRRRAADGRADPGRAETDRPRASQDAGPGVELGPWRPARIDSGGHGLACRCRRAGRGRHHRGRAQRKEQATATFKKTFGYHPIGVWCDNTQEMLAVVMRPGNAGSNTVTDHIDVLSRAIAQVPSAYRKHLLIRADGAGSSHGLLDWLTAQGAKRVRTVEYSVGYATNAKVRDAIAKVPKKVWTPATNADGIPPAA